MIEPGSREYRGRFETKDCSSCDWYRGYYGNYSWSTSCKEKPDYNGPFPGSLSGAPVSGSYQCNSGCVQTWTPNSDGSWNGTFLADQICNPDNNNCGGGFHYNANLAMCEPDPPAECPKGQIKKANGQCTPNECPEGMTLQQDGTCGPSNNECPAGQIKSPAGGCLPGDGQCAKGEVRGPDGTCKKDGDGDGDPDKPGEGDKSQFSGGDDCSSPPSCSGDAIMCGQARIQWRIDCNTRRNRNVSGGTCNAPPVCTGEKCDAVEYASMMFQWRSACAAEKLLAMGNGNGGSNGDQPAWTKVGGMSQDPGAGASADDTKVLTTKKISTDDLDQSGFGGGGSCPGFEAASGGVIASAYSATFASPPPMWCTFIARLRAGLIVVSACVSVFILARGVG
ncbi:TPA: hypothetical protein HH295_02315 [Xanthomonas vasicola pv. zeae]|uniref:Uncharacterized protein n=2 Tax=Xanthomonas vasicola TaxID=56459 RepID=A0ABD7S3S1_XANVA|nr:hypothetical protein [Xanthomonas vasicola]MDO6956305.1 hypothetical protein [Xanthomonas vasicola]MDO6972087.1 hypothetical protein [Xanthomonas vasicola]TWQ17592.1 hypothetical protein FQK00_11615 [Xanthomonas vasicola]TWQ38010.1 hypothetical protein FQJ99_05585 [Xanthomonas vasicola]TWQ46781.1 hypothetical protein FQJ98_06620 [Xanthomonas vasicola]